MYDRAPRLLSQPVTATSSDVGPGRYDPAIPGRFLKKPIDGYAPFLSMALRKSFPPVNDDVASAPGPGAHNPKIYDHIKGASTLANRSERFSDNLDDLPGPGSYNLSKADDWIKDKNRLKFHNETIPFSFISSIQRKNGPPSIPTPGQALGYEEADDGALRKQKFPDRDQTLGPAFYKINYNETDAVLKYRGIHFGKMAAKRGFEVKGEENPGPGTYDPYVRKSKAPIDLVIEELKKKSGQSKLPRYHELITMVENKKAVPGPGHYDIKSQFEQPTTTSEAVARPSFGTQASRFKDSNEKSPAPGSYNDPRHALEYCNRVSGLKKSPFGQTSTRFEKVHHTRKTPGPGAYNHKDLADDLVRKALMSRTRKGGFGSTASRLNRIGQQDSSSLPGPTHYHVTSAPPTFTRNKQNAVFESTTARLMPTVRKENVPPPGSYEVSRSFDRTQGKVLSLLEKETDPGKINCGFLSSSKRFSQPNNTTGRNSDTVTPGPGAYNLNNPLVPGGLLVIKESRFKPIKNYVPGPGTYQLSPLMQHSVLKSTFNATLNNPVAHAFVKHCKAKSQTEDLSILCQ